MRKDIQQGEVTGEVFTRPEVVAYMLDGARYCGKFESLVGLRALEPSCGDGAFVLPLVDAWLSEKPDFDSADAESFLRACDISASNIGKLREVVKERLVAAGCARVRANALLSKWLICGDFLLQEFEGEFDIVIGNPPYIRFDDISASKQKEYRALFPSFSERCDIYVPFFEKSLALLSDKGVFSFICTNRFTKSSYGKQLRRLIADKYHVALYLNMEHAQWNLKALCALLRSSFVTSQIRNVSVQMRGGSIRYQAQNLRKVHIPAWCSLRGSDVEKLVHAYESKEAALLDTVVDAVVRDATSRQPARRFQADLFG